jgi:transposase-like protein
MSWNTWRNYPLELRERAVRMVVESRRSLTRFSGQPVRETGSAPLLLLAVWLECHQIPLATPV